MVGAGISIGQESVKMPAGTSLPWQTPGVEQEVVTKARQALDEARTRIEESFLQTITKLNKYAQDNKRPLTLNAERASQGIRVGPLKEAGATPFILQPILCNLNDQFVVGVEIGHGLTNLIIGSANRQIPKDQWQEAQTNQALNQLLAPALEQAYAQAINQAKTNGVRPKTHNLTLGFSQSNTSHHQQQSSSLCLSSFLAAALINTEDVTREIGNNPLEHMRHILGIKRPLKRATRRLTLEWQFPKTWQNKVKLAIRKSESVFGSPLLIDQTHDLTVTINEASGVTLPPPQPLLEFFKGEKKALTLADLPTIVHIYGAWAYLNKGRAWGLKMNDRLLHRTNDGLIKGHVVGFYGPGLRHRNPDESRVNEGAILFIRKGQRLTRLGQAYNFDPTSYPTEWPPKPTPTQADIQNFNTAQ